MAQVAKTFKQDMQRYNTMLARKHAQAIADIINEQYKEVKSDAYYQGGEEVLHAVRFELFNMLKADNPNMDRARFDAACLKGLD